MARLLLVDDEENILTGMRRYFVAHGFLVDCAGEREEAEALVRHTRYDAAVVDLCITQGHGPDGLGVIAAIREHCPAARILVLTAIGASDTHDEALRLGADRFLQKPQPLDHVLATLRDLMVPA
ncbi:MAG: response regulator [Vicinamibacteria bacterium]|nr:response regulator [Vicinamibacteria bacterium]